MQKEHHYLDFKFHCTADSLSLSSELVVVFLKFLFQSDPVEQLLDAKCSVEVDR